MNIQLEDWGLVEYTVAYQRQKELVQTVIDGAEGRLVFCEHPPVLTLGRLFKEGSLLYTQEEVAKRGVDLQVIDRGGDITLHAPGQLVVYCIMDLKRSNQDLKVYLEKLEQVAIDLLKDFGILAVSIPGQRGVFVKKDKIASIGIGVRKWVSYHGVGLNVNTDLSLFSLIKPCGLDVQMTSMAKLLGRWIDLADVKNKWIELFSRTFEVNIIHE
jgi:lipoate-protein ligase B